MKKIIKKTISLFFKTSFVSIVFGLIMIWFYFAVKAWLPDSNWLTAQSWDVLTADKRNKLVPETAILPFYATSCPVWRKPADGTDSTPDLRWQFLRWLNTFDGGSTTRSDGKQDPDGSSRTLWSYQADELKSHNHAYKRILMATNWSNQRTPSTAWTDATQSTIATWWNETRPKNIWIIYCIKK